MCETELEIKFVVLHLDVVSFLQDFWQLTHIIHTYFVWEAKVCAWFLSPANIYRVCDKILSYKEDEKD